MAANPYEVEHNVKPSTKPPHRRRPDMASFTSHLHQVDSDPASTHAGATPVAMAGLFRLVQDQLSTLAASAPTDENQALLSSLIGALEADVNNPPDRIAGVDQAYLDTLDRVSRKRLQSDPEGACPICAEKFLDDPYPLVVELPCHGSHTFDLDCVGAWLMSKGTCPLCRLDLTKKKTIEVPKDDEEEDYDELYG
ncbi:hypothetical protein F4825DRAFT_100661 [Nemania diffusa]|nr:hypothetical protein F4825DRAFT_100661 [Nemania diffusa]